MASKGVNKVIIVGNLGNDPEMRYMPNGTAIANISVATSESWTDKNSGQAQERTEWHRISAFGRLAEIMGQYLKKGSKVYIEGSLRTDKYQDKATGQDRYSTSIRAETMQMLDSRGGDTGFNQTAPQQNNNFQQEARQQQATKTQSPAQNTFKAPEIEDDDFSDDIPF